MNVERHINKLNRLLEAELGARPLYRWIYSESVEFKRAMRVMDDNGKPDWDYRCPCGKNVSVHSAECVAGQLVVADPKWEIRKTDPALIDCWVLCSLQVPMPEDEWTKTFGTRLPYPKNGTWAPVATETYTVATVRGTLPGYNMTLAIARARQKTREQHIQTLENEWLDRKAADDKKRKDNAAYRIKDCFTLNQNWGNRGGSVSWGGAGESPALKDKGDNLVTI